MRFITHSGTFHADEVFATAILQLRYGDDEGRTVPILRVRDTSCAAESDIVYDIGGGPLDHHMKGGNGRRPDGIPYASAGLVWKAHGKALCPDDSVWEEMDRTLFAPIDAADCGYGDGRNQLSMAIDAFNPVWDDPKSGSPAYVNGRFMLAVDFARGVVSRSLERALANHRALSAAREAAETTTDGVAVLDRYVPCAELFADPGTGIPRSEDVLYVVFPSNRGGWNWQAVPDAPGSFGMRNYCPAEWRGLRDEALQAACGIEGAAFCHASGFLGSCATREQAAAMARLAVAQGSRKA